MPKNKSKMYTVTYSWNKILFILFWVSKLIREGLIIQNIINKWVLWKIEEKQGCNNI